MTTSQAWVFIVGFFTPLVVSTVNRAHWSAQVKRMAAIAVAIVVAVGGLIVDHQLTAEMITWGNALSVIAMVIGVSQTAYTNLWKPTGVADTVEARTSPSD